MVTVPQLWLSIIFATVLCAGAGQVMSRLLPAEGSAAHPGRDAVYHLLVAAAIAWLGSQTIPPGMPYFFVFKVTGTIAFLAHVGAWFAPGAGQGPVRTALARGLVYALLTAGSFAGFWPA